MSEAKQAVPTRLISIDDGNPRLRLSEELEKGLRYATLSHCWGTHKFLTLKTANLHLFRKQIPFDALTKTFRDAFHIAHYVGLFYLWIDSLCIIQDDPDDWKRESDLRMRVNGNT